MGARSTSKRRRGASADLISGLGDNVLVRILELLPDAGDAVRRGALSRRWRGLWTRVNSLTFNSSCRGKFKRASSGDKRFLVFVHNTLAQRAKTDAALDLDHLAILFAIMSPADEQDTKQLVLRSADAAREWIWYAMQKTAKSFVLKLRLVPIWNWYRREMGTGNVREEHQLEQPTINLDDLPSSAKLETMHWELGGVRLQLPPTAVLASLVDLSLENIDLGVGSGHLLARLLPSSCCPFLQKLQLRNLMLALLNELLIEVSALLELSISNGPTAGPETLKQKTPSLQILHVEDNAYLGTLGISAPKLEELTFLRNQPDNIEVDGELPCVGRLKVELTSYGYEDDDDGGICLLRCCTSLTCLEVSLRVTTEVRFTGLAGTDCESSFIQGVLAHATQLQKVALSFEPRFRPYNMIDCFRFIPCSGGTWVFDDPSLSYEWNSDPIHEWIKYLYCSKIMCEL